MKKFILACVCCLGCVPLLSAEDTALSFYQQEALTKGKTARQDRAYARALAQDLDQWLQAHPGHQDTKQAMMMKADYAQRANWLDMALITWYQVRFYFPSPQEVALLSANIEQAMDELNYSQKGQALQLLTQDTSALKTLQAKQAALLTQLVQTNLEKVYQPVNVLFEEYFTQYPKDEQLDKMTLLYGDWHRQNKNYYAAILQYNKVYKLFPNTAYKAASLRMIADVYAADLREYDTASALYDQVLKQYPDSAEIGIVYKHLAVMEENRKNYDEALVYYDKAIADLGGKPSAYDAWRGKADVLIKTKSHQAAYETLMQGANTFAGDEKKQVALWTQAAQVAQRRLKNPAMETAALDQALLTYPQTQQAPELMYEAAYAYEQQGRPSQAAQIYQRLIINYPTDKWASKAQGRLNKLLK